MLEVLGDMFIQLYQELGWPLVAVLILMAAAFLGNLGRSTLEPPTRMGKRGNRW